MERTDQQHPAHDPRAWDDEDNKPVIPKIPHPRAPRTTAETRYTFASAVADCPVHRPMHEESQARHAEFLAENGASIQRRDRIQLALRIATPRQAVSA